MSPRSFAALQWCGRLLQRCFEMRPRQDGFRIGTLTTGMPGDKLTEVTTALPVRIAELLDR
jgi:hypothetical protein